MEIIKQIDELTFQKWGFTFIDRILFLNSYCICKKESKRHKNFKTLKSYERLDGRGSNMTEDEVPLTDELKMEVINQFMSTLKVIKWSERYK